MSSLAEATLRAAAARARVTSEHERRAGGVVPTPVAVAAHALARVDALLRDTLGEPEGLASARVRVIDPAVGTGVWLAALLDHTRTTGTRAALVGIDVDPAAVRDTEVLLAATAAAQGASLALHAANTLALGAAPGDEAAERVRVIVGNPPWATRSRSRGEALSDAWLADFRREADGTPLAERRAGVLSDDYVRFFRWSLEQARTAVHGAVVCLATNASFLDGPVHRGMRAALLAGFDRIEVLDLGGNALLSRGMARDENVFGVRVGASVTWAVRAPRARTAPTIVAFGRLLGTRAQKLSALGDGAIRMTEHVPSAPWFRLRPLCAVTAETTAAGFSLADAFPFHREGVQTNRDALVVGHSREVLEARLAALASGALRVPRSRHLDPEQVARVAARALEQGPNIAELAYRPLDRRLFIALAPLCHRPRPELLCALAHAPRALLAVRKERGSAAFNLFGVTLGPADACYLSTRSSCRTRVFPSRGPSGEDNLTPRVAARLALLVGRPVCAEDVIGYALAVLGSPRFRARNEAALKLDYARLPWPPDGAFFTRALAIGTRFIDALWSPPSASHPFEVATDEAEDAPLSLRALRYEATTERVVCGERPLLCAVRPAWWGAQIGHHLLRVSALAEHARPAPPKLRDLIEVLARAAAWHTAESEADALDATYQAAVAQSPRAVRQG